MSYFMTGDEHFCHDNIRKFCKRPFQNVTEMNEAIVSNHNAVVGPNDVVIHLGDFIFGDATAAESFIKRLNGTHKFLRGNHDKWQVPGRHPDMLELKIDGEFIVACHYAMRVWNKSHFNSWQIFGHSHSTLPPVGKQWDVGVDNNRFFPVSFAQLREIMKNQPDNPNFIKERDRR